MPTAEDLELEEPVPVVPDTDDQKGNDDPISLYLHQIGQVPLLTSRDEKIAARQIEIGKRVSEIKWELEKQGKQAVAGQVFQEIVREPGKSSEIIHQLQENLGLPENASFYQTITNSKLRAAIDGVIDQIMVESIAEKLNLPREEVESRLIALSVDIALLPKKVLTTIGRKASLASIPDIVAESEFLTAISLILAE